MFRSGNDTESARAKSHCQVIATTGASRQTRFSHSQGRLLTRGSASPREETVPPSGSLFATGVTREWPCPQGIRSYFKLRRGSVSYMNSNGISTSNAAVVALPKHLLQFAVDQRYDEYTPVDHAVWRFIMRQNTFFLKEYAHKVYF